MSGKPWSQGPPLFRFSFLNKVLAVLTWYLVFVPEIAWRKEGPSVNSDRHSVHPCQSSGCRSQRTIFSLGANTAPEMMNMGWGSLVGRKQAPWDPGSHSSFSSPGQQMRQRDRATMGTRSYKELEPGSQAAGMLGRHTLRLQHCTLAFLGFLTHSASRG